MKLNRILKYAAVSALVVSTGVMTMGCTDNFENLNTDPYEVDPDELPFSAQFKEPFSYVYAPQQNLFQYCFNLNIDLFSGYFMTPHNFNGSGNVDYALNRGFCGGMYENVYLHIFNNTRRLIASCDEQGLSDYGAMMRVVQAYAIQMLTDAYGPVAYSSVIEDPTGGASFSMILRKVSTMLCLLWWMKRSLDLRELHLLRICKHLTIGVMVISLCGRRSLIN